jgi:hypothetical protein
MIYQFIFGVEDRICFKKGNHKKVRKRNEQYLDKFDIFCNYVFIVFFHLVFLHDLLPQLKEFFSSGSKFIIRGIFDYGETPKNVCALLLTGIVCSVRS